jgi:hypothetical protein
MLRTPPSLPTINEEPSTFMLPQKLSLKSLFEEIMTQHSEMADIETKRAFRVPVSAVRPSLKKHPSLKNPSDGNRQDGVLHDVPLE